VHTGAPLEQTRAAAVAHGFADAQAAPATQALHVPVASQTPAPPLTGVQALPTGSVVSTVQTGPPAEHEYWAVAAQVFDETQALAQRTNCQVARRMPFCELEQSMV